MRVRVFFMVLGIFLLVSAPGRGWSQHGRHYLCQMSDLPENADSLLQYTFSFPQNDPAPGYLQSIRQLNRVTAKNYSIKNTTVPSGWSCLVDEGRNLIKTIVVNESYYARFFGTPEEKKAGLIFVIAHEFAHCNNNDDMFLPNSSMYQKYKQELQADRNAGYAVAKLTQAGIGFFDTALPQILSDVPYSSEHPEVKYRMLAAKAGWTEYFMENQQQNVPVDVRGRRFEKLTYNNNINWVGIGEINASGQRIGVWEVLTDESDDNMSCNEMVNDSANGFAIRCGLNPDKVGNLTMGKQTNARFSGQCVSLWDNGDWLHGEYQDGHEVNVECHFKDGGVYYGNLLNNRWNGWGKFIYPGGEVYIGEWKDGKRNGNGCLYRDNTVLQEGYWENGEWKGKSPDHN